MQYQKPPILAAFVTPPPPAAFDPSLARLVLTRPDDGLERPDDKHLNQIDWALTMLAAKGYDGACLLIGNATLRMLQYAHPAVFAAHPDLMPPSPRIHANVLAHQLIVRSHDEQTGRYLEAIDHLVEQLKADPDAEGHASLPMQWPKMRGEIVRFLPD